MGRDQAGGLSRRGALLAAAGAMAAMLAPRLAAATPAAVAEALARLQAGRPVSQGRIRIDLPLIAENGQSVPLTVAVDSPMTAADHVAALHVFAEGNPLPGVASFRFTPACGRAVASTRIRLAQSQNVVCLAEMSDGRLFAAKAEVRVTVGGCGAG